MGERQNPPFPLSFNACLKVDFQGSRVTSDGGLLWVRELADAALAAPGAGFRPMLSIVRSALLCCW